MNEGIAPQIILYSVHDQMFIITGIKLWVSTRMNSSVLFYTYATVLTAR